MSFIYIHFNHTNLTYAPRSQGSGHLGAVLVGAGQRGCSGVPGMCYFLTWLEFKKRVYFSIICHTSTVCILCIYYNSKIFLNLHENSSYTFFKCTVSFLGEEVKHIDLKTPFFTVRSSTRNDCIKKKKIRMLVFFIFSQWTDFQEGFLLHLTEGQKVITFKKLGREGGPTSSSSSLKCTSTIFTISGGFLTINICLRYNSHYNIYSFEVYNSVVLYYQLS